MNRDLSPAVWAAPSTAQVSLNLILTDLGFEPLPMDIWVSNYSIGGVRPLSTLSSGFNTLTSPDTTNVRFFLIVLPRGNSTSVTLKGITGDTGIAINPNGFALLTLPAGVASIGVTTGAGISGCFILFF